MHDRARRAADGSSGSTRTRYADRYPAQLSGGERQRVGVARALAADPPVMLMDEPFGAVDPIVRERLQNEFLRLQEQLAKTILFVTHDIDEAIKMGDLVAVLQAGGRRRPVRAAGGDPRQPRVGVRRPLRRRGPRPQAAVAVPGRRAGPGAGRDRGGRRATDRPPGAPAADRPVPLRARDRRGQPADRLGPPGPPHRPGPSRRTRSSRRPRCSTAGRRSRTRSRCCSTRTCRRASSSTARAPSGAGSRSTTSRPSCASPMRGRSTRPQRAAADAAAGELRASHRGRRRDAGPVRRRTPTTRPDRWRSAGTGSPTTRT